MRVHDDYKEWNVAAQQKDGNSVLAFWTKMLKIRKQYEALIYGKIAADNLELTRP